MNGKVVLCYDSQFDFDDEDDKKFYEVAKSANAFMVTGNTKHSPQESEVVTPLRFIEILNKSYG